MPKVSEDIIKPTVISFRITERQQKTLDAIQDRDPVVGVNSRNQYARKIVADFISGKLVYTNPKDKIGDMQC